eukprot:CAMPEP_0117420256 /NCGR_PEP_ID=MMETSP0758-20121206/1625_1 /TAXON_ID=63605 /ORGANISM="Percolomonas cosmopolitus, Strain AE-1 (ATCC 50343)" /LENGTH=562 /DNA_ID=CAMNT_0005201753 /DNA_START=1 /DNA_END=1686 /DNA_ORIENTATION=+
MNQPDLKRLFKGLSTQSHHHRYFLIEGEAGFGKSQMASLISRSFRVPVHTIASNSLLAWSEYSEHLMFARFKLFMANLTLLPPSTIVFIDNLERLCPEHAEDYKRRSSLIQDILQDIQQSLLYPMTLIATCKIKTSLNAELVHLFQGYSVELVEPKEAQRFAFFSHSLPTLSIPLCETLVANTKQFSLRDLAALSTIIQRERDITKDRLLAICTSMTPSNLAGIEFLESSLTWDDVGGLSDVRTLIEQTFAYPAKYPSLFSQVPIKLRSGLLLYGPSGCGKTYMASVVAGALKINTITVNGPELFGKYIGESEANVRRVFQQAQQAAPCVLFFDEFESLAAKRGSSDSGVGDRVVNQFLCQLDGVEERRGVYILAASTRPDLIDPALLRPGRLDKALYLGFPSEKERFDILSIASKSLQFDSSVNLREIARLTKGYSGADLTGVLSTASIKATHDANVINMDELMRKEPSSKKVDSSFTLVQGSRDSLPSSLSSILSKVNASPSQQLASHQVIIRLSQSNLLDALKEIKPSVTPSERAKLDHVYSRFTNGALRLNDPEELMT